jgi:23S rRNA (uracil1939-C5)-methyltransferase
MGHNSGEILVVLVTSTPMFPSKKNFAKALLKEHPEITTVVQNINEKRTSMVLGTRDQVIYGKGYIEDTLCGKTFRISPQSFYQVNPEQTEHLYNKAIAFANLQGDEIVLDAYCGTGTIGLTMAKNASKVIGVEVNSDAVKDAKENATINGIENAEFYNEDAGEYMSSLAIKKEKIDVVITDPPRAGCSMKFLKSLIKLSPKRVVYISCNPETLANDLNVLTKAGYRVKKIQPVDMFPYTSHVECVACLEK